ncbi:hypothetical protein NQ318_020815 [Aromia moschata]|uniref:Histone-lysine N-methyltransferase SETMAR n=1 Tax=Aromia moschata TaxID=1265417 RepID=A0AAV8Y6K0_9CUCU|nr:hypothetical protein NQ318_020815 [Aromia moschata]
MSVVLEPVSMSETLQLFEPSGDCTGLLGLGFRKISKTVSKNFGKIRKFPIRNVILLHDNTRPYTANLTREKLEEIHSTTLEHTPYCPDVSPCVYHMFGPLKEALGGEQFVDAAILFARGAAPPTAKTNKVGVGRREAVNFDKQSNYGGGGENGKRELEQETAEKEKTECQRMRFGHCKLHCSWIVDVFDGKTLISRFARNLLLNKIETALDRGTSLQHNKEDTDIHLNMGISHLGQILRYAFTYCHRRYYLIFFLYFVKNIFAGISDRFSLERKRRNGRTLLSRRMEGRATRRRRRFRVSPDDNIDLVIRRVGGRGRAAKQSKRGRPTRSDEREAPQRPDRRKTADNRQTDLTRSAPMTNGTPSKRLWRGAAPRSSSERAPAIDSPGRLFRRERSGRSPEDGNAFCETSTDFETSYETPCRGLYPRELNIIKKNFRLCAKFPESNARLSVRVYGERFPNRRLPNHTTFTAVIRRLRETGRFAARTADYGRNRFLRTADIEEEILTRVEADPELSTRRTGGEMEISKDVVHRTLKEQLLHPYHKTPVQDLLIQDPGSQLWRLVAAKRSNMVYRSNSRENLGDGPGDQGSGTPASSESISDSATPEEPNSACFNNIIVQ